MRRFCWGRVRRAAFAALAGLLAAALPVPALAQTHRADTPQATPGTTPATPSANAQSQPAPSGTGAATSGGETGGAGAPPPAPDFATVGPIALSATVTADAIGNPVGGLAQGMKLLTKTALVAHYEGDAGDHPGLSALISAQYVKGGHISALDVGDAQTLDNIEAVNAMRLYEAWVAKSFANGRAGVKAGLTDLNVDFDTQQVAALFLSSSDGVGAELGRSGLNGPSIYPTTGLALSGFYKPADAWTLRAGVFDGVAGSPEHPGAFVALRLSGAAGALAIVQAERTIGQGARIEFGGWAYTAGFNALHGLDAAGAIRRLQRARGAYVLIEGPLHTADKGPNVSGWLRVGIADSAVEPIASYIGTGLVAAGLIGGRPEDQAGIAFHRASVDNLNIPIGLAGIRRAETDFEITYRTQLRDWLAIQPDAQLVFHPGGRNNVPAALVIGLRMTLALTRDNLRKVTGAVSGVGN